MRTTKTRSEKKKIMRLLVDTSRWILNNPSNSGSCPVSGSSRGLKADNMFKALQNIRWELSPLVSGLLISTRPVSAPMPSGDAPSACLKEKKKTGWQQHQESFSRNMVWTFIQQQHRVLSWRWMIIVMLIFLYGTVFRAAAINYICNRIFYRVFWRVIE